MKRDWDTSRSVLMQLEGMDPGSSIGLERDDEAEAEHMAMLIEAGCCEGPLDRLTNGYPLVRLTRLKWDGYDLLDSISKESVRGRVKQNVLKFESLPVEVLEMACSKALPPASLPPLPIINGAARFWRWANGTDVAQLDLDRSNHEVDAA